MALELTVMSLDFEAEEATKIEKFSKVELTIGRGSGNDVILSGSEVSQVHAQITLDLSGDEAQIYVTDLGSTNGTFVDNQKLVPDEPTPLESNQRILIGEYLIKPSAIMELASKASETEVSNEDLDVAENAHKPDIRVIKGGKIIPSAATEDIVELEGTQILDEFTDSIETEPEEKTEEAAFEASAEVQEPEFAVGEGSSDTIADPAPSEKISSLCLKGTVSAKSTNLNIVAKKLVPLKGLVLHKGVPLADVQINSGTHGVATTDAAGCFEFSSIVEGSTFELDLEKKSFSFDGDSFAGTVEEGEEIIFQATEHFSVSGTIIHRGTPLEGVCIDGGSLGKTFTDSNGHYEFTNVPEDTEFSLTASKDGYVFQTE